MKKRLLTVAILAASLVQNGFAQHAHANTQPQTSSLLPLYYNIKDALVGGNASLTSSKAFELVAALKADEAKITIGDSGDELLKHAKKVAESKDLKSQRVNFAILSADMVLLAKNSKLATDPIYQMYCPMKKANWLSSSSSVKNPYFGNAMLTCGKVVETLK